MNPASKNYYQILGISSEATDAEIKKAFRKLAMEFHPDRNKEDPRAEEKFKDFSEAYGVLSDPAKRREYDQFRSGMFTGKAGGPGFNYTQEDILNNMFRNASARDIFNELNREFNRRGYRSGSSFFESMLFGGAAGGLGRMLQFIPGPLGRLGMGLRIIQTVGSSLFMLKKMKDQQKQKSGNLEEPKRPTLLDKLKNLITPTEIIQQDEDSLNVHLKIRISPTEATSGVKKKIAYQAGGERENLAVVVPAGTASGSKLRIQGKGKRRGDKRGDLILVVEADYSTINI